MGVSLTALAAAIENGGTYIEPRRAASRPLADVVRDAGVPDCLNRFLPENAHMNKKGPAASIKNIAPATIRKVDTLSAEFDKLAPAAKLSAEKAVKPEPTAKPEAEPQESVMRKTAAATKTTKKSAQKSTARRAAPAKKANAARGTKPESKADIIERMLKRPTGTTRAELSKATDYPYVNLTMAAKRADMDLVEADGRVQLVAKKSK